MASLRADQTEVLYHHIEIISSQIDNLGNYVFKESPFVKALASKDGDSIQQFLENLKKAEHHKEQAPKISKSHQAFVNEHAKRIQEITKIADYIINWAISARDVLYDLIKNSVDLEVRYNHLFTIRFCQFYVTLLKISLYFFKYPAISIAVHLSRFVSGFNHLLKTIKPKDVENFIVQATYDPFSILVRKNDPTQKELRGLQKRLSSLISQISPFLLQLFMQWPICDWEQFAIFSHKHVVSDSSLPTADFIILANLQLFKETVHLFCLSFPQFIKTHIQFKPLLTSILAESTMFPLSHTQSISYTELLDAYAKNPKHIDLPLSIIDKEYESKVKISHPQRISHLLILIRDIANICSFNPNLLPQLTYKVMALGGFANYELTIAFKDGVISG